MKVKIECRESNCRRALIMQICEYINIIIRGDERRQQTATAQAQKTAPEFSTQIKVYYDYMRQGFFFSTLHSPSLSLQSVANSRSACNEYQW